MEVEKEYEQRNKLDMNRFRSENTDEESEGKSNELLQKLRRNKNGKKYG